MERQERQSGGVVLDHMRALSDLRIMLPEAVRHYPEPINNALRSVCLTHDSIVAYQ